MAVDYSGKDLQGIPFIAKDLHNGDFTEADLCGADFSFAGLHGARFTKAKHGIRTRSRVYLFTFALLASLLSGYIAMLAGTTVQKMVRSVDWRLEVSGYILFAFFLIFTGAALWKGLSIAITRVLVAPIVITVLLGMVMYLTGAGTAIGAFLVVFVLTLMASMFSNGNNSRGATKATLG